jgi:transcriptional regulator with XRE-family HTH domain
MSNMKTPQDEIKALLAKGHTQAELAKAAKVSQMTISRWASGATGKISVLHMGRIKKFADKQK